jgi:chromosome segregation ATPase
MDDAAQERIAELERKVHELADELAATRQQLAEAQLDQWKGRIDDIEVQLSLAKAEARDQMEPVLDQLRNRWLDAQRQVGSAAGAASDVFGSLRSGVESAVEDLRASLRDARRSVTD